MVIVRVDPSASAELPRCPKEKSLDDSGGTTATCLSVESESWDGAGEGHDGSPALDKSDGTIAIDCNGSADSTVPVDAFVDHKGPLNRPPPIVISEDDAELPHAEETYFHTSLIKDSLQVQRHHKANDDEVHEENPHLEDYLIPDHEFRQGDEPETDAKTAPAECCTHGILHTEAAAPEPREGETPKKRRVSFGAVLVRDYDMCLGDHPCCSYGPPVTLDWDYLEYKPLDVDEYEFHHPPRRCLREMGLNYYARKRILAHAGFSEVDLQRSKKEVGRTKLNRSLTRSVASYYPLLKAEAAVESACRKFKRLLKDDHWKEQKSLYVQKAKE